MSTLSNETICALSTPPGIGGLAVVRVSGPQAISIADACFRGKRPLGEVPSHTIHYGQFLRADGSVADYVTAAVFRAPRSYTGEDVVEITCHGGTVMYRLILESLIARGARLAEPGEFTRRAFLNGRLDLVQVESVAEIIHSQSLAAQELALKQLGGSFTAWIRQIRDELSNVASLVELELDFAQEDVEFAERRELAERIDGCWLNAGDLFVRTVAHKFSVMGCVWESSDSPMLGKARCSMRSLDDSAQSFPPSLVRHVITSKRHCQ